MSGYFKVDILCPDRVVATGLEASELLIPTSAGEINILPEHTHLVTNLDTGILTLKGSENHYFTIASGLCKILQDKVTILSTVSEAAHEIDADRAKKALENADLILSGKGDKDSLTDEEREKYEYKKKKAEARLRMAEAKLKVGLISK